MVNVESLIHGGEIGLAEGVTEISCILRPENPRSETFWECELKRVGTPKEDLEADEVDYFDIIDANADEIVSNHNYYINLEFKSPLSCIVLPPHKVDEKVLKMPLGWGIVCSSSPSEVAVQARLRGGDRVTEI